MPGFCLHKININYICFFFSDSNPVKCREFLESKEAILLAGPISLEECLDLTGRGGVVTLTSPELLNSKSRTFLIHIIALKYSVSCVLLMNYCRRLQRYFLEEADNK